MANETRKRTKRLYTLLRSRRRRLDRRSDISGLQEKGYILRKALFLHIMLLMALGLSAQPYNNEWINFGQTYYKFKVGATGLYQIPQSVLAANGMGGVPVQNFQLFRNGQEVPIYTSQPSGTLGPSDYIEFWGQMNDGVPDNILYRSPSYQHTTASSLETDTAVFFLTVNPTGNTFHYAITANNVAASTLTPEPYFMYTAGTYFRTGFINPGFAEVVGEYIYSSSYDIGEFWVSGAIAPGGPLADTKTNLYVYGGGPNASINFGMVGTADDPRTAEVTVNGTVVADSTMNSFNDWKSSAAVPLGVISGGTSNVSFINNSAVGSDIMAASYYELNYPRQFNFGGQTNFTFQLPGRATGYLLNITNFVISPVATPVLYDMTDGSRYTAVVNGSTVSFALPAASNTRNFVLVNEDPSTVQTVSALTVKNFVNFGNTANQGNFIIISNPILYSGANGDNPVMDYKNYRSSAAGGAFDAQVYDINELVDQFAFGIKKHPISIQNFLRYARANFATKPQFVLLIGHGICYTDYQYYGEQQHSPLADQLDLVPTFGYPASDNKLSANNGADAVPVTPIGRLSVVSAAELSIYISKLEEYEQLKATAPNTIAGRLWMKNGVHFTGVAEAYLGTILCNYISNYAQMISDTLCGDNVSIFCDGNASQVTTVPGSVISNIFATGLGELCYFGHSSNEILSYNLNNPTDYSNTGGNYPVFFADGCDAGDFFVYDPERFGQDMTLSETWVLAKERGSINFVAATGFGIVNYLNIYLNSLFTLMNSQDYGKPIGVLQQDALTALVNAAPGDFFARQHAEQMTTHGDPYVSLRQENTDYDIEASQVLINPSFISVSNNNFEVKARFYNLGKAVADSVVVQVTRTYPNGTSALVYSTKLWGLWYSDSIDIFLPIVSTRDQGDNKITVSINPGQVIPEVTYANNSVTTDAYIYQNQATPVYPYNYAIINTSTSKLVASTANPLAPSGQYIMDIDTTQLFNSPLKVEKTLTSIGGELEFTPGITYMDSVVYYWRVGVAPATSGGQITWTGASFVYIDPGHSSTGFNQSHYYQHLGSSTTNITLAANRQWTFNMTNHDVYQANAVYPDAGTNDVDFSVTVDGNQEIQSACVGQSLIFNVFDPITFHPWANVNASGGNLYTGGSGAANCEPSRNWNFEFTYMTAASRDSMVKFMQNLPNGVWVTVKNIPFDQQSENTYAANWLGDTTLYGSGNSLTQALFNAGLTQIDSFYKPRVFVFIYHKGDPTFIPQQAWSQGIYDAISLNSNCPAPLYSGTVTSPLFGPAAKWGQVHWRGSDLTNPATDTVGVQVIGVDTLGNQAPLYNMTRATQDLDISAVNAKQYPNIVLKLSTYDSLHAKPYQLSMWRANYTPVPEGAIAPNMILKAPDTVQLGQSYEFEIAFKNVSPYNFPDSMLIKMYILDASNVMHTILLPRRKMLVSGDTITLDYVINTTGFAGANTLYVDFNPNDQPEEYFFNNFIYKTFYVKGDSRNPTMDVTFDNVHILNDDIVSAKPHIQIKLQSQSQYLLLTDTSLITVQVKYPDGSIHPYYFSGDTVRFTPATSSTNNVATVDFYPQFTTQYNPQGDIYQLIVTGKDELGDVAGPSPYRVGFTIITKPMISNMLNYPNPFTTSTAFVFTITGSEVPQNIKIEILTITGKVVRQITTQELGPLHIGRNITEFKWNGTDMYGQRLANGVYLYHVVTNLNGQSLAKYQAAGDNTNQYFVNGYGKMYLMK
jgi:Peptidase family C25